MLDIKLKIQIKVFFFLVSLVLSLITQLKQKCYCYFQLMQLSFLHPTTYLSTHGHTGLQMRCEQVNYWCITILKLWKVKNQQKPI